MQDTGSGLVSDAVTVAPRGGTVPAGGTLDAVATFAVPADAPEGEHYGVVFVERPAPAGSGVRVVSRAGLAVYLSVGPGGEPRSDFVIRTLTAERDAQGRPVVVASVQNQGGRALSISGDLRLSDGPGGLSAGPFAADLGTVLGIGQTAPVRIVLDERLPSGPWLARLDLRSGRVQRAAQATLVFPDAAGERAAPVEAEELGLAEDPDVLIPFAGGLIGLILLALLLLLLLRRRRRKDDEEEEQDAEEQGLTPAG